MYQESDSCNMDAKDSHKVETLHLPLLCTALAQKYQAKVTDLVAPKSHLANFIQRMSLQIFPITTASQSFHIYQSEPKLFIH